MHACMHVCMYVCVHVCMYACMYVSSHHAYMILEDPRGPSSARGCPAIQDPDGNSTPQHGALCAVLYHYALIMRAACCLCDDLIIHG